MKMDKYRISLAITLLVMIAILGFRSIKEIEFHPRKIAQNIETPFKDLPSLDLSYLQNKIYFYLGQGQRCIAFVSEDGKYVIKFFKTESMFKEKSFSFRAIKNSFYPKQGPANSMQKVLNEMRNYFLCYQAIPELTGLIDIHLNKTTQIYPEIMLVDDKGLFFQVDLNKASFVAQKKAVLFKDKIKAAGSREEKQKIISAMRQFLRYRASLGYSEKIKSLSMERNYGFVGETPMQFDVGNICYFPEIENEPQEEIDLMQKMFDNWLKKNI